MSAPHDAHAAPAENVEQQVPVGDQPPRAPVGPLIRYAGPHRSLTSLSLPLTAPAPPRDGGNNTDARHPAGAPRHGRRVAGTTLPRPGRRVAGTTTSRPGIV